MTPLRQRRPPPAPLPRTPYQQIALAQSASRDAQLAGGQKLALCAGSETGARDLPRVPGLPNQNRLFNRKSNECPENVGQISYLEHR